METNQKLFELMIECVKSSGRILMSYFSNDQTKSGLRKKNTGEIVTDADFESNLSIITRLNKKFPNIPILSEESPDDLKRIQYPGAFIVDSLDGTNNFVEGLENFSVSIAYTEGEKENHFPILGVVYKPATEELYYAKRGKGAFLNKGNEIIPLRVSNQKNLTNSKLVCSAIRTDKYSSLLKKIHSNWVGSGSSALMICMVAKGEVDWYAHVSPRLLAEYDISAAHLILSESGGHITDTYDEALRYNKSKIGCENGILATNGIIHSEARKLIAKIMGNTHLAEG